MKPRRLRLGSRHDSQYPPSQLGTGTQIVSWPTMIQPYIKNEQVFVCPDTVKKDTFGVDTTYIVPSTKQYTGQTRADISFGVLTAGDGTTLQPFLVNALSYGRNLIPNTTASWVTPNFKTALNEKSGFVTTGTTLSVIEAQIQDPAGTIHICETMTGSATGDPTVQGNSIRGIQSEDRTDHFKTDTASKVAYRHNGGFEALFGDGHAKYRKYGSTTACEWSIQDDTCP